ncbi:alpha/beta hydrolase [Novosphingobium resinovorum]|uniref:alpha/beta hydrolase n=1 Tax=Novosphingobium resinovorum TaxID=158500 RepID=UPI002ED4A27C|nr:alpha/beta hydrolase [Novosphingobium resinovorum]
MTDPEAKSRDALGVLPMARRSLLLGIAASTLAATTAHGQGQPLPPGYEHITLWPKRPPGERGPLPADTVMPRRPGAGPEDIAYARVGEPALIALRPARPNGAALTLVPGGGYQRLAVGHEGYAIATRFAALGYWCFILLYRLPGAPWTAGTLAPMQDAQRALRLIRSLAPGCGYSASRVGTVGFSAGGHLAGWLATRGEATYAPRDAVDSEPLRLAFAALLYPVVTMEGPAAHPAIALSASLTMPTNNGLPPSPIGFSVNSSSAPIVA